MTYLYL